MNWVVLLLLLITSCICHAGPSGMTKSYQRFHQDLDKLSVDAGRKTNGNGFDLVVPVNSHESTSNPRSPKVGGTV